MLPGLIILASIAMRTLPPGINDMASQYPSWFYSKQGEVRGAFNLQQPPQGLREAELISISTNYNY